MSGILVIVQKGDKCDTQVVTWRESYKGLYMQKCAKG